jgi:hypothetical protein
MFSPIESLLIPLLFGPIVTALWCVGRLTTNLVFELACERVKRNLLQIRTWHDVGFHSKAIRACFSSCELKMLLGKARAHGVVEDRQQGRTQI